MNGEVCCILGVCCPPGSQEQLDALAAEMSKAGVNDHRAAAKWVLEHFDLLPSGSLAEFKRIARAAIKARG